jgi:NADH-quinone oxidoreductase subunit J
LVLAFFSSSLCLISFGIDFIGLMLMIVYVGAIAVLFLFVVMMLNLNEELYIYPLSFFHLLFKLIIYLFLNLTFSPLYSLFSYTYWYNTDKLDCVNCVGQILYGDLIFHFVGISVILMIAMVGAIALNFTPEKGFKGQDVIYQTSRSTELGLFVKFKNR